MFQTETPETIKMFHVGPQEHFEAEQIPHCPR